MLWTEGAWFADSKCSAPNRPREPALVDPFLKVVDAPGVFVICDAASVMQMNIPGVAQAGIQERGTSGG